MRTRIVLLGSAAWLLSALAGCASSPCPPPHLQEPTSQSLRAAVEWAALEANERAKRFDDQVFVEQADIDRHIFFYDPTKESPPGLDPDDREILLTDHYALAQQVRYRYKVESVGPVTPCEPGGSFSHQADIVVSIESKCRWGLARDEKPIPAPPEGLKIWADPSPIRFGHSGLMGSSFVDLDVPKGVRTTAVTLLERRAIDLLHESSPVTQQGPVRLRARYWTERHLWCWTLSAFVYYLRIESIENEPPGRDDLPNTGKGGGYGHIGYTSNFVKAKASEPSTTRSNP